MSGAAASPSGDAASGVPHRLGRCAKPLLHLHHAVNRASSVRQAPVKLCDFFCYGLRAVAPTAFDADFDHLY